MEYHLKKRASFSVKIANNPSKPEKKNIHVWLCDPNINVLCIWAVFMPATVIIFYYTDTFWSSWTQWTPCADYTGSVTGVRQTRKRACISPSNGGCSGEKRQIRRLDKCYGKKRGIDHSRNFFFLSSKQCNYCNYNLNWLVWPNKLIYIQGL